MDRKDSILSNPGKYVLVRDKEQILEAYYELFEELNIDILPFYIEKLGENTTRAHRLVITPSGVVAIASEDKHHIWEMDFETDEGKHLLGVANNLSSQVQSRDIHELIPVLRTDEQTYYLRLLPYYDQKSSEVMIDFLNMKYATYNL